MRNALPQQTGKPRLRQDGGPAGIGVAGPAAAVPAASAPASAPSELSAIRRQPTAADQAAGQARSRAAARPRVRSTPNAPAAAEAEARSSGEAFLHDPDLGDGSDRMAEDTTDGQRQSGTMPAWLPGLGYGRPLPPDIRDRAEAFYGTDLGGVRLHTGPQAAAQAGDRTANAFTRGQHIVFAAGQFAPWSPLGMRLLGHELAHTIQQRQTAPTVQADPAPNTVRVGDTTTHMWDDLGQLGIDLAGEPWVQVRWTPGAGVHVDYAIAETDAVPRRYQVQVKANTAIRVTINRGAEVRFQAPLLGETQFDHHYEARGRSVQVNEHLKSGEFVFHTGDRFEDQTAYPGHQPPIRTWNRELQFEEPQPGPPPEPVVHFFWQFDTVEQLQAFVAAWPAYFWVEVTYEGERPTAVALDEDTMQAYAEAYREEPGFDTTRIYIDGKPHEPERLYETFFTTKYSAAAGAPGDHDECLVYTHATKSFGRVTLNHGEAINQWTILDMLGADAVTDMKVDGNPFVMLMVHGASGARHEIDMEYIEGRDLLVETAERRRQEEAGRDTLDDIAALFDGSPSWAEILDDNWKAARYLRIAVDRDEAAIPYSLQQLLDQNPGIGEAVGDRLLEVAESRARSFARIGIEAAMDGLARYARQDGARELVLQIPQMTEKERLDSLAYVGLSPIWQRVYAYYLDDPQTAVRVWLDDPWIPISVAGIAKAAKGRIDELRHFLRAIDQGDAEPLHMDGDFGNEIRRKVYKDMGFNLDPYAYPHETEAAWRTQHGGARGVGVFSVYGSEAGYLYAHAAVRYHSREQTKKYLIIAAVVVASVALVLVANAAGAALAGLLFEVGTAGFVITEVVASAAIVTAIGPGMQTFIASGGSASLEDYSLAYDSLGTQFVVNLATFGFFKALGAGTRALAIAGAGGEEAFLVSRGWKATEMGLRVGLSGTAFFGIGILSSLIEKGEIPEGEGMNELIFETGLSLVLLEVGAYATRGPMQKIGKWARSQRLGKFEGQMDALQLKANALNREIAEFAVRPHGAKERGLELAASQKRLVGEYRTMLKEMQASFRTRATGEKYAKALDPVIEQLEIRLRAIEAVQFFGTAEIRPSSVTKETGEFYYKRGSETEIRDYYEKQGETVRDLGNGVLQVQLSGPEGRTLTFRPSHALDPTLQPNGTRRADVLEAWRRRAAARRLDVLKKADQLATTSDELKKIAKAEPETLSESQLGKLDKLMERAETKLNKLTGGAPDMTVDQGTRTAEEWREHLVEVKARVLKQAELLGVADDGRVKNAKKQPTGRKGLKEDTLKNHADAIAEAQKAVEEARTARDSAATTAAALQPVPDAAALRDKLSARQEDLKRRAALYGSSGSQYIKKALKALRTTSDFKKLRTIEIALEQAEARLDRRALEALDKAKTTHGQAAIDEARLGALAEMSDVQVGDALFSVDGKGKMSPQALRGALYATLVPPEGSAAKSPIKLRNVVRFARSTDELVFVLESFAAIREAGIPGGYKVLREASAKRDNWVGSIWQIEAARLVIGLENISHFEFPLTTATGGREVDIVLKDGTKVEMKDWSDWAKLRPKMEKQFKVDLEAETLAGTDASGIKRIRWMFRNPPPADLATIRAQMKGVLNGFIAEKIAAGTLNEAQADSLRQAFADHLGIAESPVMDRTKVHRPIPPSQPPMPLPFTPGRDEEE